MLNYISLLILAAIFTASGSASSNQTLVLRETSNVGATGNLITLQRKMPDIQGFSNIIGEGELHYLCVYGWWSFFREENYTDFYAMMHPIGDTDPCSYSVDASMYKSIRHLGPHDISLATITLYNEIIQDGQEYIISDVAIPNTPFHTLSLFVTGHSNWTLFERPNYEGVSACFESDENEVAVSDLNYYYYDNWGISTIGSIRKGC